MKTTHNFCSLNLTAICLLATAMAGLVLTTAARAAEVPGPWPTERANAWYAQQPWLVGCNFLPSTAVNDVEMWQADSFDAATIERELGWARDLGFNSVRVFLNFVVWQADADGLKQRFDRFLAIADQRGVRAMPVLLDDCNFAGRVAAIGRQPDPVPGVHNSQWVSSPPLAMVTDQAAWQQLEHYVKDMVGAFANDRRVAVWDLYNEPGNSGLGAKSQPLMEAAFMWAREMNPSQPLTVGAWTDFQSPLSRRMMELSDVVSFHGYDGRGGIEAKLKTCGEYGRPVLCTEWLFRQGGNRFETMLPLFRDRRIGCYNWGLVAGRTQTYFHWGSPKGTPEPAVWQHDILRRDGTPYSDARGGHDPLPDRREQNAAIAASHRRGDCGTGSHQLAMHHGNARVRLVSARLRRFGLDTIACPVRPHRAGHRPPAAHPVDRRGHLAAPRVRHAGKGVFRTRVDHSPRRGRGSFH